MRLHIEMDDHEGSDLGWTTWVDEVLADDSRKCHGVWTHTRLRHALHPAFEMAVHVGQAEEIDTLRRRNAELEQRVAAWIDRDRAAETDQLTRPTT